MGAVVSDTVPRLEPSDRSDSPYFVEPTPGLARRNPKSKNSATARGSTVFGKVEVYHQSDLERYAAHIIWADVRTRELHSQYPRLVYRDDLGGLRHHFIDLFAFRRDGRRVAYAIKQENKTAGLETILKLAEKAGFAETEGGERLIDEVVVMTEVEACLEQYENALNIIDARRVYDFRECNALLAALRSMPGKFRFGELLKGTADIPKRRAAIWHLIELGRLKPVVFDKVYDHSFLRFVT